MRNSLFLTFKIITCVFAIVGFVFVTGYFAVKLKLTNTPGVVDAMQEKFVTPKENTYTTFPIEHTPEWTAFKIAVAKDTTLISRVSKETGVPERVLITPLVPEQMRLFYTERPVFKQIFEPLKILGAQSQFSWGIMGLKEDTAREIENKLKDPTSPSYLGAKYEHMLDFTTTDIDQERFTRITDGHNHYYSYLYTALYIKEIEQEWSKAGFNISDRPEILATLYNIGFAHSQPKANPEIGGAALDISGTTYSFGGLAGMFYSSDELIELFPQEN